MKDIFIIFVICAIIYAFFTSMNALITACAALFVIMGLGWIFIKILKSINKLL